MVSLIMSQVHFNLCSTHCVILLTMNAFPMWGGSVVWKLNDIFMVHILGCPILNPKKL
jgi:hypothetical protein